MKAVAILICSLIAVCYCWEYIPCRTDADAKAECSSQCGKLSWSKCDTAQFPNETYGLVVYCLPYRAITVSRTLP